MATVDYRDPYRKNLLARLGPTVLAAAVGSPAAGIAAPSELQPVAPVAPSALEAAPAELRRAGGAFSVYSGPGEEQRAATAKAVAGIDAQTEALRSLREARNPGITAGSAGVGIAEAPRFDPFARPGDGFGDSQMRQQRFQSLAERGGRKGVAAAQALLAPGIATMQAQGEWAQNQANNQAGILRGTMDARGDAAKLAAEQAQWAGKMGLEARKMGIDQQTDAARLKAEQDRWGQQIGVSREQNEIAREKNLIDLAAVSNKPRPLSEYESTLQREQAKQQAERGQKQVEASGNLTDMFGKLDKLDQLTDITGMFAPAMATASRAFGGERAAKAEEFNSLANGIAASLVKQLPGPLTEKELQFIKDQTVQLGNTPEGNRKILQNLRSFAVQNAKNAGVDIGQLIQRRGEGLSSQGLSQEDIAKRLREEFAGAY